MNRGRFLLGSACGLAVVGTFDPIFSRALAAEPAGSADRVLVILNLQGGNDGLNTVVPYANPAYYALRPTLAVAPGEVLRLNENLGLNPVLAPLKTLYDAGEVAIIQGVGYPAPDHSHFRSTEIWQTAAPTRYESTGWAGRYLDAAGLARENLFDGVALSTVLPELFIARGVDVPAIDALRDYGLRSDRAGDRAAFAALVKDGAVPFRSPFLTPVAQIEDHAQRGAEELPSLIAGYATDAAYPATPLGRSLALAAQIIGSRLGTRVLYVQHGSFDTHTSQRQTQDRLLGDLANAVAAFAADLKAHGDADRVLTMTFSEFGRRSAENASRGTDHGEAAPLFLIGGGVKGGLYGTNPIVDANANMGNVAFTTDFRSVYAAVLEHWLGAPSAPILGGTFAPVAALA